MKVESERSWQRKFRVFKGLKISSISGFSFGAIELIQKDGNNGNFKKPHSTGKWMSGVLFSGQRFL